MQIMREYSWVRGFCYGWYKGKSMETIRRELGYARRVSLNSCRIWLSFEEYSQDPDAYIQRLKEYIHTAWEEFGISTMPILWNGNLMDPAILEPSFWEEAGDAYVTRLVHAVGGEPGLIMWDIMNEPTCNDYQRGESDPQVREEKRQTLWNFVRHYCRLVKELTPETAVTIGHTFLEDVEPTADCVDVMSVHDYLETRSRVEATYRGMQELEAKYGKPFLNSELSCLCRSNPYDMSLEICQKYHTGWYVFQLMIEGYWGDVHGIFYPDGTIRDPSIVAALMGCFRNRDKKTMIPPNPNKEGHVPLAIRAVEEALTDKVVLFKGQRTSPEQILEAAEYCANLLECSEMVPMYEPPTAKIQALREQENPDMVEIRRLAYELAELLKKNCQIL